MKIRILFLRLICKVRGHKYPVSAFTSNTLYFCERCEKEMFDRTWADLEPMTREERAALWDDEQCC